VPRGRGGRAWPVLLCLATLLLACVEQADTTPAATAAPAEVSSTVAATTGKPGSALSDAEAERLLRETVCWYAEAALAASCLPPGEAALAAIEALGRSGDPRVVAPLIDMLTVDAGWGPSVQTALRRLTGQDLATARQGYEWAEARAAGGEPLPPPPGYPGWKARLLAVTATEQSSASYLDLLSPRVPARDLALLAWTGVQPGGVPPLTDPPIVAAESERYLDPAEPVFGVLVGDEARAYPLRIVAWHGAVNDTVGGAPLLLAYCLPCGGAAAYDRRTAGGAHTFGDSGLVRSSRTVLFDDAGRLWDAFSGAAYAEGDSETLTPLPLLATTWGEWSARFPGTAVLALDTGFVRAYEPGAAQMAASRLAGSPPAERPLYAAGDTDDRLPAQAQVVGVTVGDESRAYPLATVEAARILRDTLGGEAITLLSAGPGRGVSVYRTGDLVIDRLDGAGEGLRAVDADGERWFVNPRALIATLDGRERAGLPARTGAWFAWAAIAPDTGIFEGQ